MSHADHGSGKWIDLPADTPLRDAFCEIVRRRSQRVLERIPPVIQHAEDDPEHVHQLRVATRRLAAVLRVLRLTMPAAPDGKLGRPLRKLRRLCSEARDLDVRDEFLKDQAATNGSNGLAAVLERVRERRADIQTDLDRRLTRLETRIRERSEKLAARLWTDLADWSRGESPATFGHLGRLVLQQEFDRLRLAAAPWLMQDVSAAPTEDLHQLRIVGKKFRYAAEIFAAVLPESFRRDLYPKLQELQETLGVVEDAAAATEGLLAERRELEERMLMWLGLDSGHGSEVHCLIGGIDSAIRAYAESCAAARKRLAGEWPQFVGPAFFDPLRAILAEPTTVPAGVVDFDSGNRTARASHN